MKASDRPDSSLVHLSAEPLLDGRCVKELSLSIETDDSRVARLLETPFEGEWLGIDITGDFSLVPYPVRRLVLLFKTFTHNVVSRDGNTILLSAPFDPLFIDALLSFPADIRIDGKDWPLKKKNEFYSLRLEWDMQKNLLAMAGREGACLLPAAGENLVLSKGVLQPLPQLFSNELTQRLFAEGSIETDYELKSRLLAWKNKKSALIEKSIVMPEVREFRDEPVVFYFEHRPQEEGGQFIVTAYLRISRDGRAVEHPFRFEDIKKAALMHENIIAPYDRDTVYIAVPESAFYSRAKEIALSVHSHFSEFLNEVRENIITPHDSEAFFQKFLPEIEKLVEIRGTDASLKVELGDFDEKIIEIDAPAPGPRKSASPEPARKIDWFEIRFRFRIKDIYLTLGELRRMISEGFIRKGDTLVSVPNDELAGIADFLEGLKLKEEPGNKTSISRFNIPFLLKKNFNLRLPPELSGLPADMESAVTSRKNIREVVVPGGLADILRKYQKTGVYWLHFLNRYGFGGILADEMGLGKTVQVLTFLLTLKGSGTSLIVCPTALLYNWVAEIHKFIGLELTYVVVDGTRQERLAKLAKVAGFDLAITSYPLLHNDIDDYQKIEFNYCVLDEAQHIKNKQAKRTVSVKGINARNRVAMTGTPVENNVWELWSIFDFLMPDFLGAPAWFRKHIESAINGFDREERNKALARLKTAIRPFILRRVKSNVLKELPEKIEQNVVLELTEKQKAVYIDTLASLKTSFFKTVEAKGLERSAIDFLAALTRLRQICLHPGLMNPDFLPMEDVSIKMKALTELLDEAMDSGHRVVIFSQFVEMLKIIRRELNASSVEYFYIDGKTQDRVDLVDGFNRSDIPVFLVSLKAGGTGLNLIGADSVILFDPWWNPAVENQAIDRVHRMGQMKTVNVYRLITRGTIEEKIRQLQSYKKDVFDSLVVSNEGFIRNMRWDDIKTLFELEA